ncbi:MAG TPA: LysM peptidoglycan-binding domain-containing protein [Xanthomonadales bacterium]|nr:LysM peptidoglycan-binding domain-containing protein [Xanthomonadales bacterium]
MIRKLIHFTFAVLLTGIAMAQDVSVRSDHPDRYVVVKGDTLWGISGRFLEKPWQWPAIWHANPQIENPHLIYPGDVLSLVYIDGVPQLQLSRGGDRPGTPGTVRLSPATRVVERDDPINAIPLESIKPFLRDIRLLSTAEFTGLPYIVANEEGQITATVTDKTYARGLNAKVGEEFAVMRLFSIYDRIEEDGEIRRVLPREHWKQVPNVNDPNGPVFDQPHPWNQRPQNPVAYELVEVSRVRVIKAGEVSTLEILEDRTAVKEGDWILPPDRRGYDSNFFPHAMDTVPADFRILATKDAVYGVSHYQIVSMSGGSRQGVESGHVFSVFRPGAEVKDRVGYRYGSFAEESKVRLPDEFHALIMVFRTFDDISYAMVLGGDNMVRQFDLLRHPEERL